MVAPGLLVPTSILQLPETSSLVGVQRPMWLQRRTLDTSPVWYQQEGQGVQCVQAHEKIQQLVYMAFVYTKI